MYSKTIIRFGLIITGMRVSQTSSNNCYKLLDDGADWRKSNSITMKTEDHEKNKNKTTTTTTTTKKTAQQLGGGTPLHNQSFIFIYYYYYYCSNEQTGTYRLTNLTIQIKKGQIVLQVDIAFFRMQGKMAVGCVENAGEHNSWFTVFTLSMTASSRKTVLLSKTHMGVTPPPPGTLTG